MLRIIIVLLFTPIFTIAQVGIGTSTPNASAQLDVSSTTKGFLPPRMTQAQRQNINSPTAGLMVYQTDGTAGLWYYTGNAWIYIINSTSATLSVANGGTGETTIPGVKSILGLSGANVAIGSDAGSTSQGYQAIAIGSESGKTTQGVNAIAIGGGSGRNSQGLSAIGIGYVAGDVSQGTNGIAIGSNAAQANQSTEAVAIGYAAGQYGQGAKAVALGSFAGNNGQAAGSIAINASGVALNPTTAGLYINPIRSTAATTSYLNYDATTKEVTHSSGLAAGSVSTTTIIDGAVTDAKIASVSGSKVTGDISGKASNVTGTVAVANGGTGTTNGSITGTGALTFTAGGTNQNVTLTPSGTGGTILNGNVGIGTNSPNARLDIRTNPTSTTDPGAGYLGIGTTTIAANTAGTGAVRYNTSSGGVLEFSNGTNWNTLTSNVQKATVVAKKTSAQSVSNMTSTDVTSWDEITDLTNNFDPTTGVFTAPRTGNYVVSFSFNFNFGTINAGTVVEAHLISSGGTTNDKKSVVSYPASGSAPAGAAITFTIKLASGETVKPVIWHSLGVTKSLRVGVGVDDGFVNFSVAEL